MGTRKEALMIERIPFQFQLSEKSDFEAGRFAGIASVWGSVVDTFPNRTRFRKGAFLKTINDRANRVKILANHDQFSTWIGVPTRLQETEDGLLLEASLNNTTQGRDIAEALRHLAGLGKLDAAELSIGFDSLRDELVEDDDDAEMFREILEARLWEISVVNFGADRKTKVIEAASANLQDDQFSSAIDSIHYLSTSAPSHRHAKTLPDHQRSQVEDAITALQKLLTPAESPAVQALTEYERWRRDAEADLVMAGSALRS
jgi:HK97 family phage prohead protease